MRYGVVRPDKKTFTTQEYSTLKIAMHQVGLVGAHQGNISHKVRIITSAQALFVEPEKQHYFSIGKTLYGGPALIHGVDIRGKAAPFFDWIDPTQIRYYDSFTDAVAAIERDEIDQPSIKVGNDVIWSWPQPMPGTNRAKADAERK